MGILEGPVICRHVVDVKHAGVSVPLVNTSLAKARLLGSGFWGSKGKCKGIMRVGAPSSASYERKHGAVSCSFSSSSDGNGSMAGNFNESDEDYVNSSVIEADTSPSPRSSYIPPEFMNGADDQGSGNIEKNGIHPYGCTSSKHYS